jgi:triosephosphate isomerase (TIM)
MRKTLIAGNWKSNGNVSFVKTHFIEVLNKLNYDIAKCDVLVSPINLHLGLAKEIRKGNILLAAQNISASNDGAFTGEISAKALKDFGINWSIVGHSERRAKYGETNQIVSEKIKRCQENGIKPILCVGETKDERQQGKTLDIIFEQLKDIKDNQLNWSEMVIAYEPVWAIGTGLTASPQQAQEVHNEIRSWLRTNLKDLNNVDQKMQILYGGSVTEKNADELIKEKDIDGFLVGGASLKPEFANIVKAYKNKINH